MHNLATLSYDYLVTRIAELDDLAPVSYLQAISAAYATRVANTLCECEEDCPLDSANTLDAELGSR